MNYLIEEIPKKLTGLHEKNKTSFDLRLAAFSVCCCFFKSSGVSGNDALWSVIRRTWGRVIALEAAYCCGHASALSKGISKPPLELE